MSLFTDLYQLTMAQAYLDHGMSGTAVFSLFVRRLPKTRNYLVACGLDAVLARLESLRFGDDDIEYLRSLGLFSDQLFDWLRSFRFSGDVYAVPEGTPVFANEPLIEVVAPLPQAQYVETLVMNLITVETAIASKAARLYTAADGRSVVDFGARRAHGMDAAVRGARAAWIAGLAGTSNVLAAQRYGIPPVGTMAHSYVQAHDTEEGAFEHFARRFPGTTLLVDTYDTLEGVRKVIELATRPDDPVRIGAVRLDSGDLASLARDARRMLDEAGLTNVRIFASGGLDEEQVAALIEGGAPIDAFGIGTSLMVSEDAPALDIVYKLAEYEGRGRTKLSLDKPILPGRKQVFRRLAADGSFLGDVIGTADEKLDGTPLLECVMKDGRRTGAGLDSLGTIRARALAAIAALPPHVRALAPAAPPYPVEVSPRLQERHGQVRSRVAASTRPDDLSLPDDLSDAALLIVDVQNDFCPGGALAVPDGDRTIPVLNRAIERFVAVRRPVYASRDWHPIDTRHFADHGGRWPVHCVAGSTGAAFHPDLRLPPDTIVVTKGQSRDDDGYSVFEGTTENGSFIDDLRARGVRRLFVGGLATDYCVRASVLDARAEGLQVIVIEDAVAGIAPETTRAAFEEMKRAGAEVL